MSIFALFHQLFFRCHNVNFVTPEHVVPQVIAAVESAVRQGFNLPVVYNTSGYDSERSLELLDGVVDIYMPDFKFWKPETCLRYWSKRLKNNVQYFNQKIAPGTARPGTTPTWFASPSS